MVTTYEKHTPKGTLLQVLQKPMTGSELLVAMRPHCPRVQLRDVWRLLKNLEEREIVYCLTPGEVTGRLYFFTEKGRQRLMKDLGIEVKQLPPLVNWKKYAHVVRAHVRKAVLIKMEAPWKGESKKTIATVRKSLLDDHPIGLGAAIRATRELEKLKLIRRVGLTEKRSRPLYLPTAVGKRILLQLKSEVPVSPYPLSSSLLRSRGF